MSGTATHPRLSVYRSNKHLYLQAIDDQAGKTMASANDKKLTAAEQKKTKSEQASAVAVLIAKQLKTKKVDAVIFDRGAYKYHGRVKAVAEGLREAGIKV